MRISRYLALATAALLAASLLPAVGCAADEVPSEAPGITGTITDVLETADGASIRVEGGTQPAGAVSDKAQVAVTGETDLFGADGTKLDGAEELAVGQTVRVWFTGPVAESYPVQGTAAAVQVVSSATE